MTGPTASKLIITGASGQLGRATAMATLAHWPAGDVILVTRRPEAIKDLAALGADVRFGDFDDPASLRNAFVGGKRMLLISATDLERRVGQHQTAIDAAKTAGVQHVIYTSGLAPEPPNPAAVAPSHYATELALADSGLDWTVLRNSLYADYQVVVARNVIEQGKLVHNQGDGKVAYVARDDCARAAAAVLSSDGHAGRIYDITGPKAINAEEFAALCAELSGRDIAALDCDDEAFIATLVGDAAHDDHLRFGAALVASFGRSIREGYMASCTNAVETLTGQTPRTLREMLDRARSSNWQA
jgi:NAD(P)H dehydrogenase (quinone)